MNKKNSPDNDNMNRAESEWKKKLSPKQFEVLRKAGTESPFQNAYYNHFEEGMYACAACGKPLFQSDSKFKSSSGWPSFRKPVSKESVLEKDDNRLLMRRVEVVCSSCESHLGHVFEDGPQPEGTRYCINSAALDFKPDTQTD